MQVSVPMCDSPAKPAQPCLTPSVVCARGRMGCGAVRCGAVRCGAVRWGPCGIWVGYRLRSCLAVGKEIKAIWSQEQRGDTSASARHASIAAYAVISLAQAWVCQALQSVGHGCRRDDRPGEEQHTRVRGAVAADALDTSTATRGRSCIDSGVRGLSELQGRKAQLRLASRCGNHSIMRCCTHGQCG